MRRSSYGVWSGADLPGHEYDLDELLTTFLRTLHTRESSMDSKHHTSVSHSQLRCCLGHTASDDVANQARGDSSNRRER
jgi:hypothetical protein